MLNIIVELLPLQTYPTQKWHVEKTITMKVIATYIIGAAILFASSPTWASETETADAVCLAMARTKLVSGCKVGSNTINMTIQTSTDEAVKMCTDSAELISKQTLDFKGKRWLLNIYAPYGSNKPLATCQLY